MGRRPNQLVVEFFQRGKKLEDASNRYEHTCRRCGEVFPKGRIDALISHILRRCPHVTQQDRQLVSQQVQHGQDKSRLPKSTNSFTIASSSASLDLGSEVQSAGNHHSLMLEQQSALDTLAEVSRRHLDYSSYRPQVSLLDQPQRKILQDGGQALAEQALIASLQQHVSGSDYTSHVVAEDCNNSMSTSVLVNETLQPNAHHFEPDTVYDNPAPAYRDQPQAHHFHCPSTHAEHPLHHTLGTHTTSTPLDPKLHELRMGVDSHPVAQLSEDNDMIWGPEMEAGLQTFGSLSGSAIDGEHSQTSGVSQKGAHRRRRGVFSDRRREEVKANRKRGACLRCRMLKKSCSDGTPCNTCSSIETARVWKNTCIRTRIVDTFPLWSTALFHHKALVEVPAAVEGLVHVVLPGRLEVSLCTESDFCMSFAAKQYTTAISVNDGSIELSLLDRSDDEQQAIWLLDEGVEMADKIEDYIHCIADVYIQTESSACIKALLCEARSIVREERLQANDELQGRADDMKSASAARSCYSLQDQLVKCMVQLWVYTRLLSNPDALTLQLQYNAAQSPQQQPSHYSQPRNIETHQLWDVPQNSYSHDLIKSQLLALAEERCIKLNRVVMNEMERRLLQRKQVSRNATFISALILLNCVERTTSFYQGFDSTTPIDEPVLNEHEHITVASPNRGSSPDVHQSLATFFYPNNLSSNLSNLPLDRLWLQGERFADLLVMMLRLRGLPPKTTSDAFNNLITTYGLSMDVHRNAIDDHDDSRVLSEWLDPLELSVFDLVTKRDSPLPSQTADPSTWDMRFISRVLLPDSQH